MKMSMSNEAKTGLVVVICAAILAWLLFRVGNFTAFQHGYTIRTLFHSTEGIKKSSPVRLSGVSVGEVRDMRLIYKDETWVELVLWIHEGVKIHLDSKASIATMGLMGEKYVEIYPGSSVSPWVKECDTIFGQDSVRFEDLIQAGTKVAGDISQTAKDISKLANHLDEAVHGNQPKLDTIFSNLEETSENFREFSQDIKYHPWKILFHGKEKSRDEMEKERGERLAAKGRPKDAIRRFP